MSESVQIPIEADTEGFVASLRTIRQQSEDVGKTLKQAFAAEVIVDSLGKIAGASKGTFGEIVEGIGRVSRGFLQGGPFGLAIAAGSIAVEKLAESWGEQERAAKASVDAAIAALDREKEALARVRAETKELALEKRALVLQETEGLSAGQAAAKARLEAMATDRKASQERLAALRDERAEAQKRIDEINAQEARIRELQGSGQFRSIEEGNRLARQFGRDNLATERVALRSRLSALDTERDTLAAAMVGGRESLENQETRLALEGDKKRAENRRSIGDDLMREEHRRAEEQRKELEAARREAMQAEERDLKAHHESLLEARREYGRQLVEADKEAQDQIREALKSQAESERDAQRAAQDEAKRIAEDEKALNDQRVEAMEVRDRNERDARDAARIAKQEEYQNAVAMLGATQSLADTVMTLGAAQRKATKEELEEQAKRAGVKAIMATAEAAMAAYAQDYRGAALAAFAAVQFGYVAGSNSIAAGQARGGADREADPSLA